MSKNDKQVASSPNTISKAPRAVGRAVWTLVAVAVLVGAGLAAYSNSFDGVFLFDDMGPILDDDRIRTIWPIWDPWAEDAGTRPVMDLSLKINWALADKEHDNEPAEFGFHVFNLAVHILAGLTLFGIVRRTLRAKRLAERFGRWSDWLALAAAVLWLVHPLHTSSVTYIIQRAESMMGLFYLLTLYCAIRYFGSSHRYAWLAGSVAACLAGAGCKQVIVTVPVMVLLYDWVFVSGGLGRAFRRHWPLHAMLVLTWVPLLAMSFATIVGGSSAGFGMKELTASEYAAAQFGVIGHYLRLSFWPSELCLDYMWPRAETLQEVLLSAAPIILLLGATLWTFKRRPAAGYLGAWFFLILAPSSSIMPIKDLAFEHRMYLSLAAVAAAAVIGGYVLLRSLIPRPFSGSRDTPSLAAVLVLSVVAAVTLGVATYRRNLDYADKVRMWSDVAAKRPGSARAHYNLGRSLTEVGRRTDAIGAYKRAVELQSDYADALNNMANLLRYDGRLEEAFHYCRVALRNRQSLRSPHDLAGLYINMGIVRQRQGEYGEAIEYYSKALEVVPQFPLALNNIGVVKERQGKLDESIRYYERAIELRPGYVKARASLARALARTGRLKEAADQYRRAIEYAESSAEPEKLARLYVKLGDVTARQGKYAEAAGHFEKALEIQSDLPGAAEALAKVRSTME